MLKKPSEKIKGSPIPYIIGGVTGALAVSIGLYYLFIRKKNQKPEPSTPKPNNTNEEPVETPPQIEKQVEPPKEQEKPAHRRSESVQQGIQTTESTNNSEYIPGRASVAERPLDTTHRSEKKLVTMPPSRRATEEHHEEFKPHRDHEHNSKHPVSYERCQLRAAYVSKVTYELTLHLCKGREYEGHVKVIFNLKEVPQDLFLDAHISLVKKVLINGKQLQPAAVFSHHAITLPLEDLKRGENTVDVFFVNDYTKDGSGLHSVTDAEQMQYLWAQSQPIYAHRIFPCFDQPDIKASIKVLALAPQPWALIANERANSVYQPSTSTYHKHGFTEDFSTLKRAWEFRPTPPIPTYAFTICAGPYEEIRCTHTYNNTKMSLYCRKAVKAQAKESAEHLFFITNIGLQYFEELFGCAYPFSKYDIILCPEFNWGAMENAGAVTFSESNFLFFEPPAEAQKLALACVALHELVHMWFGDFVTMSWWDDLWLNESFASFISYHTLATHPILKEKYPDSWVRFLFYKDHAYAKDQLASSHPVATHINNTTETETHFDEIVYAKGAACLKQLVHLLGFENFCIALKSYFAKHAWKNTKLEDFFFELNSVAKDKYLDLNTELWKEQWIHTAGLNTLDVLWESTEDGRLDHLLLKQEACNEEFPQLRVHHVRLGFFDEEGGVEYEDVKVDSTFTTAINLNRKAPAAILVNYADHGFVKIRIDEKSQIAFGHIFHKINDSLARALVWKAQIDMVHDGRSSCTAFADFLVKAIEKERHPLILLSVLKSADFMVSNYIPSSLRAKKSSDLFHKLYQIIQLESWELNSKEMDTYLHMLVAFAREPEDILTLIRWMKRENLDLKVRPPTLVEQWQIVIKSYASRVLDENQLEELFTLINDTPDNKNRYRKTLDTMLISSSEEIREKLWNQFLRGYEEDRLMNWSFIFQGFNYELQAHHYHDYIVRFFDCLIDLYSQAPWEYFRKFYAKLFPRYNEDFELIIQKILEVLSCTLGDEHTQEEGYENLIKLLKESLEETKKRSYCVSLSTSITENHNRMFLEFLGNSGVFHPNRESFHILDEERSHATEERRSQDERLYIEEQHSYEEPQSVQPSISEMPSVIEEEKAIDEEHILIIENQAAPSMTETEQTDEQQPQTPHEESYKTSSQAVIENLENMVRTEESFDNSQEEDETWMILSKSWRKSDSERILLSGSLFKDWIPNGKQLYTKLFKTDTKRFVILERSFVTNKAEYNAMLEALEGRYYIKLLYIFMHFQVESKKYPEVAWADISSAFKAAKLFHKNLSIQDCDRMVLAQLKESPKNAKTGLKEKNFFRFEFIELLLRMGLKKYSSGMSGIEAVERFLEVDIIPGLKSAEYAYEGFRYERIQTQAMNNFLNIWVDQIKAVFDSLKKSNTNFVTLQAVSKYLAAKQINLDSPDITKCFGLSKMLVIDEIAESNAGTYFQMNFVEFLEFLTRVANIIDETEELSLPEKVQNVFPKIL